MHNAAFKHDGEFLFFLNILNKFNMFVIIHELFNVISDNVDIL